MDTSHIIDVGNINYALLLNGAIIVIGTYVLNQVKAFPYKIWGFVQRTFSVTIEVSQGRDCYETVVEHIGRQKFITRMRNLSVVKTMSDDDRPSYEFPPAPGVHAFWYRGRIVTASRNRRDLDNMSSGFAQHETLLLTFFFAGRELAKQFVQEADAHSLNRPPGAIRVCQYSRWYGWQVSWRRSRDLSTVFLAPGIGEDLISDVSNFFDESSWYIERGIPHRRGYMLEGPPGNGKTSVVRGIANELNLNITSMSLAGSGVDDETLMRAFSELPPRSCVLLEDIDCIFHDRDAKTDSKITFSGLLNALDGVHSQEGYILIMTTNHPEVLDPALVRPGRVDRRFHIGNATPEQASAYFNHFYGPGHEECAEVFSSKIDQDRHSMASIQSHLCLHKNNPVIACKSFS